MLKRIILILLILNGLINCVSSQLVDQGDIELRSIYERNSTSKGLNSAKNNPDSIREVLLHSEKLLINKEKDDIKKINSYKYLYYLYGTLNDKNGQNRCMQRLKFLVEKTEKYSVYLDMAEIEANKIFDSHNANDALKIYMDVEKILKAKNKNGLLCQLYFKISDLYSKQLNHSLAIRYLLKAQDIAEEIENNAIKAETYFTIAKYYCKEKVVEKSSNYLTKSREYYIQSNSEENLAITDIVQGEIYIHQKEYKKAIIQLENAIKILDNYNNYANIATAYEDLGVCYENLDKNDLALSNYQKSLALRIDKNDIANIPNSNIRIGKYYSKIKEIDSAEKYFIAAFNSSISGRDMAMLNISAMELSKLYKKLKNYEKAYKYFAIANEYYDDITNQNSGKEVAQAEMEYSYEKERNFTKEIEQNHEELLKRNKLIIILTSILGSIILVMLIIMIWLYRKQIIKNKQINCQNEELKSTKNELLKQTRILATKNKELEKLSIVARQTDNSIFVTDTEGNILWLNEAFVKNSGFGVEEYLKDHKYSIFKASGNPVIRETYKQVLETKHAVTYTSKSKTKDGRNVWIQTNLSPAVNDKGEIDRLIAVCSDITELKIAQNKIDEKNKEINESLKYAKKIQDSIQPMKIFLNTVLNEYFIINIPKNIVSGDFYWVDYKNDCTIIAVADCTGHGIPGGFMSMLGQVTLTHIISSSNNLTAAKILNELRTRNIKLLHQRGKIGENQDGMDASICIIDNKNRKLNYAGAYSYAYLLRKGKPDEKILKLHEEKMIKLRISEEKNVFLVCFKPDRMPVGIHSKDNIPFRDINIEFQKDDILYMTTDGFSDQFGGINCKKLHSNAVEEKFIEYCQLSMQRQEEKIIQFYEEWKGDNEQIDDIQIIGIKLE